MDTETEPSLLDVYSKNMAENPDQPTVVCAVNAFMVFLEKIDATTFMEIRSRMEQMANELTAEDAAVALKSGCELFLRTIIQSGDLLPSDNMEKWREIMRRKAQEFVNEALDSRNQIAALGAPFIRNGATILTHGLSRVVLRLLQKAAEEKQFKVIVTLTDDASVGKATAERLSSMGIPTILIPDAAVAHVMNRVDLVVVGAEGIVESGGILNRIGTLNLALAASTTNKPFYAVAESFKFVRKFPLSQGDIPLGANVESLKKLLNPKFGGGSIAMQTYSPLIDYTPPQYIQLLFTDLGVLTPSAVSDQLIQLYQ